MKKEEGKSSRVVVGPEDEKYRLGYGVVGKGVKLGIYLEIRNGIDEKGGGDDSDGEVKNENKKKNGRKTLEELREERLKREKHEKEQERNDCQYDDVFHLPVWQSFATSLPPASNMNGKFERDYVDAFFSILLYEMLMNACKQKINPKGDYFKFDLHFEAWECRRSQMLQISKL
ncbi:hypothetical protein Ahy_B08g090713 isoform A [Arachis hypogaea]|uniref:Uncharacterized protein n=1 Tax=Arachis hypogaea TaxID=3818 RepID=A0A444Y0I7_ARAHY|nr:hypothetical protein Ahy_B08g090713 isoform A [Arachis hypogaea]